MTDTKEPTTELLQGKYVAFVGKLGGVSKREAQQTVRRHGGVPVESDDTRAELIVIGADESPIGEPLELLDDEASERAADGHLQIISETEFWHKLGFGDNEDGPRLYTPAMLADLLDVPLNTIRRWHRKGVIVPAREVHRLPYFDFQEVASARHLAQLLSAGASPKAIEAKLSELSRYYPNAERPLAQLGIIVEGKQILLRQGEGLVEPSGQLRIDFDALGTAETETPDPSLLVAEVFETESEPDDIVIHDLPEPHSPPHMRMLAETLEDEGNYLEAIEVYRALLASEGPTATICFRLAELLYLQGDGSAARERYYMAIELDENYVEARASLGNVLAEQGDLELAVAAFEGALTYHDAFPDVHFHLAKTLEQMNRYDEARVHWQAYLDLAPESPWATEARNALASAPFTT